MNTLGKAFEKVLGIFLLITTVLVAVNVFMRYVLKSPFSWCEEICDMSLVWIAFLGAAALEYKKEHVKIDIVVNLFNEKKKKIIIIIANLCVLIVLILHVWSGIELVKAQSGSYSPALRLPMSWFSLAVPVGLIGMVIFNIFGKNIKE